MARFAVRVTPRASRDEIAGWRGSELSVRVTAAPDGGRANAAVEAVLASALGIPKTSVKVVRGHTSRSKQVEASGVTDEHVGSVLGHPDPGLF